MEISPVGGVSLAPMVKYRDTDLGMTDVFEIDKTERTGDDAYSSNGSKAGGGFEEDEENSDSQEDDADLNPDVPSSGSGQINYTA
jgi:hypothetical protein